MKTLIFNKNGMFCGNCNATGVSLKTMTTKDGRMGIQCLKCKYEFVESEEEKKEREVSI